MSEEEREEQGADRDELLERQAGKGYGEDEGERDEALDDERPEAR